MRRLIAILPLLLLVSACGQSVPSADPSEITSRSANWEAAPAARPMGGGPPKTHLMITHEVDDAERWLAAWRGEDSRHDLFKANGAKHVHTFRNADNPNLVGLVVAVDDLDALNTMLGSEEGIAAAAADGVRADTITVLTEAK